MVENNIGPINYAHSVDLVYSPNYEHLIEATIDPPTITIEIQEMVLNKDGKSKLMHC